MLIRTRSVEVHQVPAQVNAVSKRNFILGLRDSVMAERPRFILDCSKVCKMNSATMQLLLSALEEAMKCNGDVRLAAVSLDGEFALKMAGVSKLFEIHPTTEAAAQSFHQRPRGMGCAISQDHNAGREAWNAA